MTGVSASRVCVYKALRAGMMPHVACRARGGSVARCYIPKVPGLKVKTLSCRRKGGAAPAWLFWVDSQVMGVVAGLAATLCLEVC